MGGKGTYVAITKFAYISPTATPTRAYLPISTIYRCPGLYIYDKLVVEFGFPYSPTACLRPHNLVHVPTPAYAPKGNAYIHNDQCQPPDKSFCLSKNLCSKWKVMFSLAWIVLVKPILWIDFLSGRVKHFKTSEKEERKLLPCPCSNFERIRVLWRNQKQFLSVSLEL